MELDELKKRVEIFTSLVSTAGLLIGGGFALIQYSEKNHADRVRETLGYVEKLSEKDIRQSRQKLAMVFVHHASEWEAAARTSVEAYDQWLFGVIAQEKLVLDIYAVGEVYDRFAICMATRLCDKETGNTFLVPDARAFYREYGDFIANQREVTHDPTLFVSLWELANPRPVSFARRGPYKVKGGTEK
jgi:hypothetical protein